MWAVLDALLQPKTAFVAGLSGVMQRQPTGRVNHARIGTIPKELTYDGVMTTPNGCMKRCGPCSVDCIWISAAIKEKSNRREMTSSNSDMEGHRPSSRPCSTIGHNVAIAPSSNGKI
ncbi:hypothetical protein PENANT_c026G08378 [Penicillium antarcticum]|uniref:Uncharacterized protein n=1 Tax=Penicillium antarcticum TaxID=416450 RepID=A0A1V6PX68_9EURO|nr:hypothetical protein PENANT_c026G08378 [Penicillium antarcticum]